MDARHAAIWRIMKQQGRSITWLAQKMGLSYSHVRNVRKGIFPATADFRARCVEALDIPEDVLFGAVPVPVA